MNQRLRGTARAGRIEGGGGETGGLERRPDGSQALLRPAPPSGTAGTEQHSPQGWHRVGRAGTASDPARSGLENAGAIFPRIPAMEVDLQPKPSGFQDHSLL